MLIISLLLSLQAFGADCTVEGLSKNCGVLKSLISTQYVRMKDGTYFRNPEYDNWKWSWLYVNKGGPGVFFSNARVKRVDELFAIAREAIIQEISGGRAEKDLSPQKRNQIERIRLLHFSAEESAKMDSERCPSIGPNAEFSGEPYEISICKRTMILPDHALIFTIGHEIGHAIGSCTMASPLVKRNGKPAIDFNAISKGKEEVLQASVPLAQHPERDEVNCLIGKKLAEPLPSKSEQFEVLAKKVMAAQKIDAKNLKQTANWVEEHATCFTAEGHSNPLRESTADAYGTIASAKLLRDFPPQTEMEKLATMSHFIDKICGKKEKHDKESEPDPHLPSDERLNKIFLADPRVQSALGCTAVARSCHTPEVMANSATTSEIAQ